MWKLLGFSPTWGAVSRSSWQWQAFRLCGIMICVTEQLH